MAAIKGDALVALREGWDAVEAPNPYLWSSTCWEHWEVGAWLRKSGHNIGGLEKGRGSTWKSSFGSVFRMTYGVKGSTTIMRE